MSLPVRFALIGTGNIAAFHAQAIALVPEAKLVAAFSRSNPAEFAAKHGCEPISSLDGLLARSDVDAVCITTPSGAHGAPAIAAMRAGKHVLCEKPMEITPTRVDEMLAVSKETGRILGAIFQSRFGRGAVALKKAVEQGRFGRLTVCSAYIKWWRAQAYYDSGAWRGTWELDGGGALMNQGIHAIDLLQWLVGLPSEVSAFTATLAHERIAVEDTAVASLRFPNGALGVVEAATSAFPGAKKRIEISGEKGTAILEDDTLTTWAFESEQPGDEEIRSPSGGARIGGGAANPMDIGVEGHRQQIADFCAAIQEGRAPTIDGKDARSAVALINAIYDSVKKGRPVSVSDY